VCGYNGGVAFEGVVDEFGVAERCFGVEMVCASGELDPLVIRRKSSEMGGDSRELNISWGGTEARAFHSSNVCHADWIALTIPSSK